MPSIDDLIMLMRGDVITPQDALGTYEAQEQARKEKRIARRQAMAESQSEALDSLSQLALGAAGEPTDLQGVMRAFGAEQEFASGNPQNALDSLFLPTGQPQSGFEGNAGQSRLEPRLRPEDAQQIAARASQGKSLGAIMSVLSEIYGPNTLERLMPEVQKIYSGAAKPSA